MEHPGHLASPWELFWPFLNFAMFVALLIHFLRGPVIEYFRARTVRLREALRAGARARQEATTLRASLARDVENLPALSAQLRADMRAAAEVEREHLLALGRKAAERIRADARLLAEQEVVAARQALRAEMIDDAIHQAAALMRRALRPEDQERLVRDFVSSAGAQG
jgi:F-type H+-transporting ATPase subunit b